MKITIFLLTVCLSINAYAQETILYVQDTISSPWWGGSFGMGVAIHGDHAIFGDIEGHPIGGGAAYIFEKNNGVWEEKSKLVAFDSMGFLLFGRWVAINDEYAAVTHITDDENGTDSGAVFLFKKEGGEWAKETKLIASDGSAIAGFGSSLMFQGDHLFIAADADSDVVEGMGAVYIFEKEDGIWTEQTKIVPANGELFERFGIDIDASEDYLVVAAPRVLDPTGTVYVFEKNNGAWEEVAQLNPEDMASNKNFGGRVAIFGDRILVGTKYQNAGMDYPVGAAYVFRQEGAQWVEEALLLPSDATEENDYCWSVSLDGNMAVFTVQGIHNSGRIYVFQREGEDWEEKAVIRPSNGNNFDQFGRQVIVKDKKVYTGAYNDTLNEVHTGAAYIYNLDLLLPTHDIQTAPLITLYPNPAEDVVYILGADHCIDDEVSVFDLSGRLVKTIQMDKEMIRLTGLSHGLYLIKVNTCKGEIIKKLVLSKH